MWRQNSPQGNQDSDEILSDEEELDQVTHDNDCTRNLQSLYSNERKKEKVQLAPPVLFRLESLTDNEKNPISGDNEVNLRRRNSLSPTRAWKLENFSSDRMSRKHGIRNESHESLQSLPRDEHHNESFDDSISDEENTVISKLSTTSGATAVRMSNSCNLERKDQYAARKWSAAIEEAQELAVVPKKTDNCPLVSETYEARGIHKGNRGKAKVKFSFRPMPRRGNLSALKDGNGKSCKDATDCPAHKAGENSVAELFGNLQEENDELPMKVASHDQRGGAPSMAELLENLQQKDVPSMGPPNLLLQNITVKEIKTHYGRKGIFPHLGSRVLDSEDPPEYSGGGFSGEDEDNDQSSFCGATETVKGHTVADLFQDAFRRSEVEGYSFPPNKQSGIGYHGRLQQILQVEKDRHLDFLKHSQTVQSLSNYSGFMDVQILSRFLEAKLTVCRCLVCFSRMGKLDVSYRGGTALLCFPQDNVLVQVTDSFTTCQEEQQPITAELSSVFLKIVGEFSNLTSGFKLVTQAFYLCFLQSSQSVMGMNKCATEVVTERTIIFNSKICDNVELAAGNFVRIHPPWKEVQVNEDEKIFLCMYFSPKDH